jgi:hypothetical protein
MESVANIQIDETPERIKGNGTLANASSFEFLSGIHRIMTRDLHSRKMLDRFYPQSS